jgi:hypothetical protein
MNAGLIYDADTYWLLGFDDKSGSNNLLSLDGAFPLALSGTRPALGAGAIDRARQFVGSGFYYRPSNFCIQELLINDEWTIDILAKIKTGSPASWQALWAVGNTTNQVIASLWIHPYYKACLLTYSSDSVKGAELFSDPLTKDVYHLITGRMKRNGSNVDYDLLIDGSVVASATNVLKAGYFAFNANGWIVGAECASGNYKCDNIDISEIRLSSKYRSNSDCLESYNRVTGSKTVTASFPKIKKIALIDTDTLQIDFSETMKPTGLEDYTQYMLSPTLSITDAKRPLEQPNSVVLTADGDFDTGTVYSLSFGSGLVDRDDAEELADVSFYVQTGSKIEVGTCKGALQVASTMPTSGGGTSRSLKTSSKFNVGLN